MNAAYTKYCTALVVALLSSIAIPIEQSANAQAMSGAVWVDPNGNVIGPALGQDKILLKIPTIGNLVLPVEEPIYPSIVGDPIRWRYTFGAVPESLTIPQSHVVMSFQSADCTGQGYVRINFFFQPPVGNAMVFTQFFDSVHHWLVASGFPAVDPIPRFNSQIVQSLQGPGSYCQTVDVLQGPGGGYVLPVTNVIDQQPFLSPPLMLQ